MIRFYENYLKGGRVKVLKGWGKKVGLTDVKFLEYYRVGPHVGHNLFIGKEYSMMWTFQKK